MRSKFVPRTFVVLALVFAGLVLAARAAWVGDDAYITYRAADNLVHGFGPVWNVYERVQAFTNPLWMFLFSCVYVFTGNAFYTSIGVQCALTTGTLWIMGSRVAYGMGGVFVVFGLLLSKAFVDYSTSGLENPLTHFLLAVFFALYLRKRDDRVALAQLSLVASLAILTRFDTAIAVLPPLLARTTSLVRVVGFRHFRTNGMASLLVGATPLLAFLVFGTFYYGFPFPNTAYAKLAGGLPLAFQIKAGLFYLHNSLFLDPVTLGLIALAIPWAFFARDERIRPVALSIVLHVAYTVRVGGDFMSGRFLTVPLLCAVVVLCSAPPIHARFAHGAAIVFALLVGRAGRFPSLSDDYTAFVPVSDDNGISDARRESLGIRLADATRFRSLPAHPWVNDGKALRARDGREVIVRGAVGLFGYYAGPKGRIIDSLALTDPLLARLPIPDARHEVAFRAGHLARAIPEGYRQTIETGQNHIEDPGLAAYYDKIRLITQGPLFRGRRLVEIVRMNLGLDDHLLDNYRKYNDIKKVTLGELARGGDKDRWDDPTSTQLGLRDGALFYEYGILVALGSVNRYRFFTVELSERSFDVAFMHGRERIVTVSTDGLPGQNDMFSHAFAAPVEATTRGFDGVLFLPREPPLRGSHAIKKFDAR